MIFSIHYFFAEGKKVKGWLGMVRREGVGLGELAKSRSNERLILPAAVFKGKWVVSRVLRYVTVWFHQVLDRQNSILTDCGIAVWKRGSFLFWCKFVGPTNLHRNDRMTWHFRCAHLHRSSSSMEIFAKLFSVTRNSNYRYPARVFPINANVTVWTSKLIRQWMEI